MGAIAIVGMGCRFGGAEDLTAYWEMLREGRAAFGPVPPDRWDAAALTGTNSRDRDRTTAPAGAFVRDIRSFPALALGIPPRRVEVMDPQQRFALWTALEAIEDAGLRPDQLPRRTGVYVGLTGHEYRVLQGARVTAILMAAGHFGTPPDDLTALADAVDRVISPRPFSAPGVLGNMTAAVVAQELDVTGPAYTVDAACASGIVAVHDAVAQLRTGAVDAALAGGAYLQISPEHYIAFSRIGAMSASGRCLPFDDRADGFVQGDGVGMVLLKRLEDAERDGDRIYAVIHGVAVNNDGRGDGPMAPVQEGQVDVIRTAWSDAGIDPARATHVETHGTGTKVGDACEADGVAEAFAGAPRLLLGSSKANVGHTMSAAGIAGLIKAALSVHHELVPPMAGFESAKDGMDEALIVPTEPTPWDDPDRLVGISSFGFGGTNGHAVLGAHPGTRASRDQLELVLISAPDEATLADLAGRTADALRADPRITVAEVARAWSRRRPQPCRTGLVARSREELITSLDALSAGAQLPHGVHLGTALEAPSLAFLYPGQGAQRLGMLRDLRERLPTVRRTLDALEIALAGELHLPLTHLLYPELRASQVPEAQAAGELTATEHCQPVMHAAAAALTEQLAELGIQPDVVTGHSLGEFTAATVAGVADPQAMARFVARRGAAVAALPGEGGAMAAIMADEATVRELLVEGAVIANLNHPRQTVVSGTTDAIATVIARAEAADVGAKPVAVSHAFHSPLVAELDLGDALDALELSDPDRTIVSAISGAAIADADEARAIFTRHAVSPVRFTDALRACREAGADLFVQIGAGGPLASFARGTLAGDAEGIVTLASRDDDDGGFSLLDTLAFLWTSGVDMDITPIIGTTLPATLPPSVLPTEPYWSIKETPARRLILDGAAPRHKVETPPPAPVEASAPAPVEPAEDDVAAAVLAVIARVSAYPLRALKPSMKLVDDLGFDSLMVGDLATRLAEAFPGLGGIPQTLLMNAPTIADMIAFVETGGAAEEVDDDAPLVAFRASWTPVPLPDLPGRDIRRPVIVSGADLADTEEIARGLTDAGLPASAVSPADVPADTGTLVWVGPTGEPHPLVHLYNGHLPWPDQAEALLRICARLASSPPDLIALSRDDDPWAAGLAGALRSLAREWPVRVTHLRADDPVGVAALVPLELASAEATVDLRYVHGLRHVRVFTSDPAEPIREPIGPGDTVLVTGGTRGIGLSLGLRLAALGAEVLLLGRRPPDAETQATLDAFPNARVLLADITDRAALRQALGGTAITHLVHAAGMLADGPVASVDPELGKQARRVKVDGWLHAVDLTEDTLKVAVAIGSWAGSFGNRHQTHYAAANALLESLVERMPANIVGCMGAFGPWVGSAMADSIPAPVQQAMRAEGVDFVGQDAGLDALGIDLLRAPGSVVWGRRVPADTRALRVRVRYAPEADPFLADHALDGTPVLPLAAAADLMAWVADTPPSKQLTGLTLFRGIPVSQAVDLDVSVRAGQAEIRQDGALCYAAAVTAHPQPEAIAPASGGAPSPLSLEDFYGGITFHGPLLQGLRSIDGVGETMVRGTLVAGRPTDWTPASPRTAWSIDPLALDSAMQLAATVAWHRFHRAGTPVSIGRLQALGPLEPGHAYTVEAWFTEPEEERFSTSLVIRDDLGNPLMIATDVVADLRPVDAEGTDEDDWTPDPASHDFSQWPEVQELQLRLDGVEAMGLQNPYFHVHEGTARDTTVVDGRELVNFSSYNYIGLSGDPDVLTAVHQAADRYGTSVSASRVASGERPFHAELEKLLAQCQGSEDALLFTAGHATNVTTIGHLMGPDDLVLHDEYIHDSALQGIKLSGAARRTFRHEDPAHLEEQLKLLRPHYTRCLIIVEGVYSMDGDICQLPAYIALKKQHACLLMVDEAHSFGIVGKTGCGVGEHWGIDGRDVDIWMGTLSKSLSSCGGWIAGSKPLITYLRYTAPGFVYSAGLTPANGVAALASLKKMLAEPERVRTLQDNATFFCDALKERSLDTGPALGGSGVVPVITGNSLHALVLSQRLLEQGINVQPIVYPAVPDDASRLRFFLSSTHTREQLGWTAETVATTLARVREDFPLP